MNYSKSLRQKAEQGNVEAQNNLGFMYLFGLGVAQDYKEAVKWYKLAAEQEYPEAQHNLGYMYRFGLGVAQDDIEAVKWYKLAVEQGFAKAQNNLGYMYLFGLGVAQDYKEAVKWYRLAAEQEYQEAQYNLGLMYDNGKRVTQDYKEAVKWYRLAAEQGHANAQNNLGFMYHKGEGVTQDYNKAIKWYRLAAKQGNADAKNNLRKIDKEETNIINWLKARKGLLIVVLFFMILTSVGIHKVRVRSTWLNFFRSEYIIYRDLNKSEINELIRFLERTRKEQGFTQQQAINIMNIAGDVGAFKSFSKGDVGRLPEKIEAVMANVKEAMQVLQMTEEAAAKAVGELSFRGFSRVGQKRVIHKLNKAAAAMGTSGQRILQLAQIEATEAYEGGGNYNVALETAIATLENLGGADRYNAE